MKILWFLAAAGLGGIISLNAIAMVLFIRDWWILKSLVDGMFAICSTINIFLLWKPFNISVAKSVFS